MHRLCLLLLATQLVGCLADGRPEAEFLQEYGIVLDMGVDASVAVVSKHDTAGDECSTAKPTEVPFIIELDNEYRQDIFLHLVDREQDCTETFARVIRNGLDNGVDGWDGAVYRIRDAIDGEFMLELRSGDATERQFVVVP